MTRLGVILCGLCEAEVDVVNLMEEMKITPGLLENFLFCFCAETDTVGAEKDTICAETENISAEMERFFNERGDFKYKGGPSVFYGCRKRQN
jgi:hypothetical protein